MSFLLIQLHHWSPDKMLRGWDSDVILKRLAFFLASKVYLTTNDLILKLKITNFKFLDMKEK